jgi:hypothetical protein
MAKSGKNLIELRLPDDPIELDKWYHQCVKRILRLKTSKRAIANRVKGISHTTIQNIFNDPDRRAANKTKQKIIRIFYKAPPKKKRLITLHAKIRLPGYGVNADIH